MRDSSAHAIRRSGPLVLSSPQQRLLFVDQLRGGRSVEYVRPVALRLRGPLDPAALMRAIHTVVGRHEVLRTYFTDTPTGSVQVIAPDWRPAVRVEDRGSFAEADRDEAIRLTLEQEGDEPFDLLARPPLRIRLLRFGADDHVLVRSVHHIAFDGWSQAVWNRELVALYAAHSRGAADVLPPLAVQYADYARWQQDRLADGELDRGRAYWMARLAGLPERHALPTDRTRPRQQSFTSGQVRRRLAAEAVGALRAFSRSRGVTLYMTLLGALSIVMARHGRADDIVIGTPAANRVDPCLERLIGLFVNLVVIRLRVPGRSTVRALLDHVRTVALGAYAHQHVPFERVVEDVRPSRSGDAAPLFQVLLAFQNMPKAEVEFARVSATPRTRPQPPIRCDIAIYVREHRGVLECDWHYSVALFDEWRITQLAIHFERVLLAMVADNEQSVADVSLLDPVERDELVNGFGATPITTGG